MSSPVRIPWQDPLGNPGDKPEASKKSWLSSKVFLGLVFAVLYLFCPLVSAESSAGRKQQITAGYLYHFIQFTQWPLAPPVIHFCVYEDSDFTALLEESYTGKTIFEARIEVKNINAGTHWADCQLIYFPQAAEAKFLEEISQRPILTVGAQAGFTKMGGIIYLFEEEQKLRFNVNYAAALNAGLKISSQLLKLSKEP